MTPCADGLLADRVLGNLRHGQRHLPGEQRLGGFDLHGGDVQIRRAEIQREPGFAGVFMPLGDGHRHPVRSGRFGGGRVDARAGEGNRSANAGRPPSAAARPGAGGKGNAKLARAVRLAENRLALRERLPAFAVGWKPSTLHGLDEIVRRSFERDAVERLRQSGFQRDDRVARLSAKPEMTLRPNDFARRRGALDQIWHFVAGVVVEPQVFQRRARGIERFGRQAQLHQAGRGHVELLLVLPFGGQARGAFRPETPAGSAAAQDAAEAEL